MLSDSKQKPKFIIICTLKVIFIAFSAIIFDFSMH